ncbi:MAG: endopeptidase La [Campylobacterota bacterium]|nr:endopeptidase La [Campylobacterota bacterium]
MKLEDYDSFPDRLPILIEDSLFLYPFMIAPIFIGDEQNINAVEYAINNNKLITVAVSKDTKENSSSEFYNVAVVGNIMRKITLPDGRIKILFQGLEKVEIKEIVNGSPLMGIVDLLPTLPYDKEEISAILDILKSNINKYSKLNSKFPIDLIKTIEQSDDPNRVADLVSSVIQISNENAYALFKEQEIAKRLLGIIDHIKSEIEGYILKNEINKKVNVKLDKHQKEYYLKEQLKTIQKELGTDNTRDKEIAEFRKQLKVLKPHMPKLGYKEVKKQIDKLSRLHPDSGDASTIQTYIEQVLEVPFGQKSEEVVEIHNVEEQLNKDHYALEEPKDRIVEYFAVKQLLKQRDIKNSKDNSTVLCFAGPPGVGKTSLANSIATALKRPLVRIALGGMEDVNELRGHRRTYVGAMPGRIVHGLTTASKMNPVIVLDEIDKIGANHRGDPSAVMLEILDPEQNHAFRDLYLNFDIDLSSCIFIATANNVGKIPAPLRDRMEFITVNSYTPNEKLHIAKSYLIPQELKKHGLKKSEVNLSDATVELIIEKFTREAGVRNLRRVFSKLYRKSVKELMYDKKLKKVKINTKNLEEYLDSPIFEIDPADKTNSIGVVNGLAWTSVGGDVLKIETAKFTGKGALSLTGNMGDVMKESARIAHSVIKGLIDKKKLPNATFKTTDIHMHIPEGATPKDGPSAGAAMCLVIASILSNRKVDSTLAMTGEITLTGKVLPIGGLKEKLIAAYKAKMKRVLIPTKNYNRDLKDIPEEVKENIEIIAISKVDEVLKYGLV